MTKEDIKEILISRDEYTADEADEEIAYLEETFMLCLMEGNPFQFEEVLLSEYNLEPDYLEAFIQKRRLNNEAVQLKKNRKDSPPRRSLRIPRASWHQLDI